MGEDDLRIVRSAFAEASLAAKEKGLSGYRAATAVRAATAKVASRILGRQFSVEDIDQALREPA